MLYEFLSLNRDELIRRCRSKVAERPAREASEDQLQNGIPMFLGQLIQTLEIERGTAPATSRKISGPDSGRAAFSEISVSAAEHGRDLLRLGFSIDQVVHDYGDLCQAITDLAYESRAEVSVDEFRSLNRCLDNAIAEAVTEFSYQRDFVIATKRASATNQRLGFMIHEFRNELSTATLAFQAAKLGNLSLSSATGTVLERSLARLAASLGQSLDEVKMVAGISPRSTHFLLAPMVSEIEASASLVAASKGCTLTVAKVDTRLALNGDREVIMAAVGNLLHNAFKYTHRNTEIVLSAYAVGDRIMIDVEDHCGGLPIGMAEQLFKPFVQGSDDRSGLGLGLAIAKRGIELNGGTIAVRDVPGTGCVFTISLARDEVTTNSSGF
ncbi:MAG: HAMP domain-containing sensor histidine kinase [Burkholderiaceae bacterium]|jgi:signal transduction histidine kinase